MATYFQHDYEEQGRHEQTKWASVNRHPASLTTEPSRKETNGNARDDVALLSQRAKRRKFIKKRFQRNALSMTKEDGLPRHQLSSYGEEDIGDGHDEEMAVNPVDCEEIF